MPTYIFSCDNCQLDFEHQCSMSEITSLKPRCPKCKRQKGIHRNYGAESPYCFEGIKTVGSYADKNTDQKSDDEQHSIRIKQTEYLRKPYDGPLPEGVQPMPRDKDGHIIPSTKQRKVDPRRK
jgi:putative FmdB family regulatory protein